MKDVDIEDIIDRVSLNKILEEGERFYVVNRKQEAEIPPGDLELQGNAD